MPDPIGKSGPFPQPPPLAPAPPAPKSVPIPPALAGKNPIPAKGAPPPGAPPVNIRDRTIHRRQTLLSGLGLYKGKIDGVWGPNSQRAWAIYIDRKRKGKQLDAPVITAPFLKTNAAADLRKQTLASVRQQSAAARKAAAGSLAATRKLVSAPTALQVKTGQQADQLVKNRTTAAAAGVQAANVVKIQQNYKLLKTSWSAAASMGIDDLQKAVDDPGNKDSSAGKTTVVQRWLVSHGETGVKVTGKYDQATHDAILNQRKLAQAQQYHKLVQGVTHLFFSAYPPGSTPTWWTEPGPTPTPAALSDLLMKGGFKADNLIKQILQNSATPETVYADWRNTEIAKLMSKYSNVFTSPNFVALSGNLISDVGTILLRSATVLGPKAYAEFAGQVGVLQTSRTGDEFARRIAGAVAAADLKYQLAQRDYARHHMGWFPSVVNAALSPMKSNLPEWAKIADVSVNPLAWLDYAEKGLWFFKTAAIADYYIAGDFVTGDRPLSLSDPEYWAGAKASINNQPPLINFVNHFLADPLLIARPLRLASTTLRWSAQAVLDADKLGLGTYDVKTGLSFARAATAPGFKVTLADDAFKLTTYKAAYIPATFHLPITTALGKTLRRLPGVESAIALKESTVERINAEIIKTSRNGFIGRTLKLSDGTELRYDAPSWTNPLKQERKDALEKIESVLGQKIMGAMEPLMHTLFDNRISLYNKFADNVLSAQGEHILGAYTSEVRATTAHGMANKYAWDVYERASQGYTSEEYNTLAKNFKMFDEEGNVVQTNPYMRDRFNQELNKLINKQTSSAEGNLVDTQSAAQRAWIEYQRVIEGVGFYGIGTGDPELRSQLAQLVNVQKQEWEHGVMPVMQRQLEFQFSAAGHDLYDPETAIWVDANKEFADDVLALEAYTEARAVVKENPLFGKAMTYDQMIAAVQEEISMRNAGIMSWAARQRSAGNELSEETVQGLMFAEDEKIKKSYVKSNGGRQIVVNRQAVSRLLAEMGLPENFPVEVRWVPGSKSTGSYYGKKVYLNVSRDWLSPDEQRLEKMNELSFTKDAGSRHGEIQAKIDAVDEKIAAKETQREGFKKNARRLRDLRIEEGTHSEGEANELFNAQLDKTEALHEERVAPLMEERAQHMDEMDAARADHLRGSDDAVQHLYHGSLAHEIRHGFQQATMSPGEWMDRKALPYWDRPIEKDAKAFAHSEHVINFDDLVSVINEPPGSYYDARRVLSVPDIHAKHLDETYFDKTGQERPPWLHSGVTGLPGIVAEPLTIFGGSSHAAQTLAEQAWNLSSFASSTIDELLQHAEPEAENLPSLYGSKRHLAHKPKSKKERQLKKQANKELRMAVRQHNIQHKAAMDGVLPFALKDNKLFMAALSQAESWPLRNFYKFANGAVNEWIFYTLPMRPGWGVRNVVDNALKTFIAGAKNPKAYFGVWRGGTTSVAIGEGVDKLSSIMQAHIGPLVEITKFFDRMFGTDAATHFESILDTFWHHDLATVSQILKTHGLNIPDEWLEKTLFDPFEGFNNILPFAGKTPYELDEVNLLGDDYIKLYNKHFGNRTTDVVKDKVTGKLTLVDTGKDRESAYTRFKSSVWHVMANTPENYYKKVNFHDDMVKLVAGGMTEMEAFPIAWKRIEDTLFDYSKISAVEDNLRLFFPFIQFWRKNTVLWAKNFAENPWLTVSMNNYFQWRDDLHKDEPAWMRRYFSTKEITDAAAVVPGLGWLASTVLPADNQFDPMSFFSFTPYYRAFKSENPTLPADQQGWKFVGGFLDGLNDWGLGLNPFIRKPLESFHVASQRSWQTVFPETPVAAALTHEFFNATAAGYVMNWEYIFQFGQGNSPADERAQNFEFYVRRFEENQIAKGLPANRAEAEANVKMQFLVQNLHGYFSGVYYRHNTPEDYYAEKLQDQIITGARDYKDLSERDRTLLAIWNKGGIDKKTGRLKMTRNDWNRYIETIPLIQAFFAANTTFKEGQQMIQDHPELRQYVDPLYTSGKYYTVKSSAAIAWYLKSAEFFDVNKLFTETNVAYDVRKAASTLLVTPELQKHWAKNDTPADERNKMIDGLIHQQLHDMNQAYFSIPESDIKARQEYIALHPEMERGWQAHLSNPDDFKAIDNHFKADLRNVYFATVKEHGFDAAHDLLVQFPFMFEGTKSESHIDEKRGIWVPGGVGSKQGNAYLAGYNGMQRFFGMMKTNKSAAFDWLNSGSPDARAAQFYFDHYGKKHNTAKSVAFRNARSALKYYFHLRDDFGAQGKALANAWLSSGKPEAKIAKDYFDKWSKTGSYHAHDFLRAEKWLKIYWGLPPAKRGAYLKSNAPGAKILRQYFAKWADDKKGMSAQAQAYVHAKDALDYYFSLPKADRRKFLKSGSKDAALVLDYFKRFSSTAKLEKAFWKLHPNLKTTDPELRQRMSFWKNYFTLSPADRPQYILDQGANHGIFVYGALGDGDAHNREQKFIRQAVASKMMIDGKQKHLTTRQASFLYVKPLLNMLATISDNKTKSLFIEANPELQEYLKNYSKPLTTGNPKLDYALGAYFSAEPGSAKRFDILAKFPQLQKYFDKHSTPADRAMHSELTVFFSLSGQEQLQYKLEHPEIQDFFDKSRLQKAADALVFTNLELADPRLHDTFAAATTDESVGAAHMREKLQQAHINQFTPDAITTRRDRLPQTSTQTRKGQGGKKAYKQP